MAKRVEQLLQNTKGKSNYTAKNLSPGNSKLDFMVSQHPKLKSGRFVKGVLAKVG